MSNIKSQFKGFKKQAGISLMEVIASLLIIGLVVAGALALFGSADASQKTNQIQADVASIRSAVKGIFAGQGGYGTTNLNNVLQTANKLPSDLSVDTSTTPYTITHSMSGTIAVVGATTAYTITLTNIPTDVCVGLLTNAGNGWSSIKVGGAAALTTFPITPAIASSATNCAASATNTVVFTGI